VQKTLLWKNAKPSLPGSPCHCRYHDVAPQGVAAVTVAAVSLPSARHTGAARSNSNISYDTNPMTSLPILLHHQKNEKLKYIAFFTGET